VEAERRLKPQGLDVTLEPRGLVISLQQSILFASGDDQVSRQALPALSQIANVILGANNKVVLVGHADTIPIHNRRFSDNWQLSAARSLNLLALLTWYYRIPESRLSIQSYGSNHPLDSNDTEAGRAANRRVEILILDDPTPEGECGADTRVCSTETRLGALTLGATH
jgi:chemotaxis protein MotB